MIFIVNCLIWNVDECIRVLSNCSQRSNLLVNDPIVYERFISGGILFQITGYEYAKLSLCKLDFGLGIVKLWLVTERSAVSGKLSALNWKKSIIYCGSKLLATLYIVLALLTNTFWSNDRIFNLFCALSKSSYSFSRMILHARLWSFVNLDTLEFVELPHMLLQ